ncbi:hypothetical protein F2Q69_00015448 [Brassica cretica]|uniref:Uncharacterized protein n=1 Tax=Brassica cretica TaxID=69181 RepID=A0A8S9QM34_BRACR|nr:hypothetical protein F2Q69_00015448 [Brassica cretica]
MSETEGGVGYLLKTSVNQPQVGSNPCVRPLGSGHMRGGTSCSTWIAAWPGVVGTMGGYIDGDGIFVAGCVPLSTRIDGWKMNEDGTGLAGFVSLSRSIGGWKWMMNATNLCEMRL